MSLPLLIVTRVSAREMDYTPAVALVFGLIVTQDQIPNAVQARTVAPALARVQVLE